MPDSQCYLLLGDHNSTLYNCSKNRVTMCDVECHKNSNLFFLLSIGFKIEWHNSHFEFIKNKQIKNLPKN